MILSENEVKALLRYHAQELADRLREFAGPNPNMVLNRLVRMSELAKQYNGIFERNREDESEK
jgi:hypothetical protein